MSKHKNLGKRLDVLHTMRQAKKQSKQFLLFCALTLLLLWSPTATRAQSSAPGITLSAVAGFDGFYKTGSWLPVHITAGNNGPAIEGELRMSIGSFASGDELVYNTPVSLPTQSNKRVTLYINLRGMAGTPTVQLLDQNGRTLTTVQTNTLTQLANDALLYGVVSPDPGEFDFLQNVKGGRTRAAVAYLDIDSLPAAAAAWDSLDVLVFHDTDTGVLSLEQQQALQQWVRTGGQLVVAGGPGWQKTTAALTEMLPVTVSGSEAVADLPALSAAIGAPLRDAGPYLVTTSSLRSGELLYHQDGLPLLARQAWGQGQVYFLALDPKLAPLLDWSGNEQLWTAVADIPQRPYWAQGVQNSYAAGTAVASLPSLVLPSTLTLVAFLLIYILVIGPGNYLILKRKGRRELAWGTIPVLVILFSGVAYLTGFQLKGNTTILNQMSIVSGSINEETTRVQTLVGLYSPRRGVYDVVFPAGALARPFERNFGDIGGRGSIDAITQSATFVMSNARVDVSAVETFVAQHYHTGPAVSGQAVLELNGRDIVLNARIQNNGDVELENAVLLLGTRTFALGSIKPGDTATTSAKIGAAAADNSSAGITYYGPSGSTAPLMSNANTILGTSNYYDDRAVYPRWQLLEAMDSRSYGTGLSNPIPSTIVTLIAWSQQPQLDVRLDQDTYQTTATTLYLLEIPLQQNLVSSSMVSLPLSLLDWKILRADNVYNASIENLYLEAGTVEFEYTPWPDFQTMQVTSLAVALTVPDYSTSQIVPEVNLWDWQQESWITIEDAAWGETAVADYGRFLGPHNAVRLQLRSGDSYGVTIQQVYPIFTGDLKTEP